jgi:two-component system, LytTR family, response regulator
LTIRTIVVDDEAVARRGICQRLRDASDVEVIAECDDGTTAIEAITDLRPDLVLLDLQMPGLGGFDVVESVGLARMAAVIFVTAFDQFAVRAFDVHAIDYVLKPIDAERFALALQRARRHLLRPAEQLGQNIVAALKELDRTALRSWSRRLAIRCAGRIVLIEVRDIDRCEAAGNYVEVHVGAKAHVLRETLTNLESRLDPTQFVRISRSSMVNIERVRELHPMLSGDFVAVMADGSQVAGSRRFRETLDTLLR